MACVVADAAVSTESCTRICFLDDRYGSLEKPLGFEVIGTTADLAVLAREFDAVAVGNVSVRRRLLRTCFDFALTIPTIVHARASVSRFATLGAGTVVLAQSAINPAPSSAKAVSSTPAPPSFTGAG